MRTRIGGRGSRTERLSALGVHVAGISRSGRATRGFGIVHKTPELARLIDRETAESLLARALKMRTTLQVQRHLAHALHDLAPDLEMLDTH